MGAWAGPWGATERLGAGRSGEGQVRSGLVAVSGFAFVPVHRVCKQGPVTCDLLSLCPLQVEGSPPGMLAEWPHPPIHFEIFKRGLGFRLQLEFELEII